nr:formate dehydrogenase accessory sulfurtransferase FdhD [Pseudooceanicola algae]
MVDPFKSIPGRAVTPEGSRQVIRTLPEEWPVAIVHDGTTLAVMMASPQDLEDFAIGFSLSEGVIRTLDDIAEFEMAEHEAGTECRFWLVDTQGDVLATRRRAFAGPVGCGLCGIDSLEAANRALPQVPEGPRLSAGDVARAVEALRGQQPLHDRTRAVHAAGFLLPGQGLLMVREDVGRHNALDKLIGALALAGISPSDGALVMTSRLSVELIQKAAVAQCAILIGVSAPTAHAVRLAEGAGLTLAAFARGDAFDLYAHPDRIRTGASDDV